jgi:type II secretion system protein F
MPQFTYRAKREDGKTVSGSLQAESERAALDSLGQMGVFPIEIAARDERKPRASGPRVRRARRVRPDDIALLIRQLADLLRAGVPLNRALDTLAEQTSHGTLSQVMDAVGKSVAAGQSLHEAFSAFPAVFPPLHIGMIRAGEAGGFLEDVLQRLAMFIEKDQELKSRIKSALAYPVLLIIVGTFAVAFLMVFFIPRFSEIFAKMGDNLPWTTQVVMAASYATSRYWMVGGAGIALGLLAWMKLSATLKGRRFIDTLRLRAPLFGDIVRKNAISRFTRTLGTLLRSGVPILEALGISKEALGNRILMDDIEEAAAGVKQGRSLAEILRTSHQFPPMVVDMIAVGEEGGNLDEVLVNVAESYDRQVDRAVRVFIALFEPALLMVMATIVGFIVISMLLPVFSLSNMIR